MDFGVVPVGVSLPATSVFPSVSCRDRTIEPKAPVPPAPPAPPPPRAAPLPARRARRPRPSAGPLPGERPGGRGAGGRAWLTLEANSFSFLAVI